MIADTDRLRLPVGVSCRSGRLSDTVRCRSWSLNASGAFVLGRADRPLETVVLELADAFGLPLDVARRDVLGFVWTLNALALVNVIHERSRFRRLCDWLRLAARLAPAGALPAPLSRRRSLDTGSATRALVTSLAATGPRVAAIASAATALLLQLTVTIDGRASGLAIAVVLGAGTGIGVGLHEAGHAVSLTGVPSALVLRGRRTFVLHAAVSPGRRVLVALSGPATVVVAGVVLVAVGVSVVAPGVALLGLPLVAHALSLTVVGSDGRVACGL